MAVTKEELLARPRRTDAEVRAADKKEMGSKTKTPKTPEAPSKKKGNRKARRAAARAEAKPAAKPAVSPRVERVADLQTKIAQERLTGRGMGPRAAEGYLQNRGEGAGAARAPRGGFGRQEIESLGKAKTPATPAKPTGKLSSAASSFFKRIEAAAHLKPGAEVTNKLRKFGVGRMAVGATTGAIIGHRLGGGNVTATTASAASGALLGFIPGVRALATRTALPLAAAEGAYNISRALWEGGKGIAASKHESKAIRGAKKRGYRVTRHGLIRGLLTGDPGTKVHATAATRAVEGRYQRKARELQATRRRTR